MLIQYVGMISCVKFQHLSRNWYTRIQTLFNNMSEPMEVQFQEAYADYFNLIDTQLIITPTQFGNQKGIRIDRLMQI